MSYESLDPERIVETIEVLARRIRERFPTAGLGDVCQELLAIGRQAKARTASIAQPILWLRASAAMVIILIVTASITALASVRWPDAGPNVMELIQVMDAGLQDLLVLGASIFFLATLETRIKRNRALRAIDELRAIAHIIDMHQLTKDPERVTYDGKETASSPRVALDQFQLGRYLDYSSEMLSLTGKIAALYGQKLSDPVVLAAVNEVETLTTGLSRKIWQKIMIIHGSTRGAD